MRYLTTCCGVPPRCTPDGEWIEPHTCPECGEETEVKDFDDRRFKEERELDRLDPDGEIRGAICDAIERGDVGFSIRRYMDNL